ncbi:hypothetical protein FSP39_007251 [Pinctada imbricata]|uniref:B box-type domain-containing protein n=1 Tax=Pinctada imbricata TaxID=66713 RepID=A0AA88Y2Q1_PINIB|nr:hypothetical protein FSP39_007251 [Pinctada imbricata]
MAEGVYPTIRFPQTTVECEGCGAEFDVNWFCKNCPASLCDACKEKHSKDRLMKKHEVVLRTGSVLWTHGSWKLNEPCQKHKGNDLVTYCNECKTPCCLICTEEKHKTHDWTRLNTKYFDAESLLNALVDDLSKSSIPTIQNETSNLKQKIDSCNEDFSRVNSHLNIVEDELHKALAQSFDVMRKDLSEKQSKCISKINEKIENFESQIKEIEILIASTEQKIRAGGLDLIEYNPECPQILSCHSDVSTPVPYFVLNEGILNEIKSNLGKINYDDRKYKTLDVSVKQEGDQKSSIQDVGKVGMPDLQIEKISSFQADIKGRSIKPVGNDTAWLSWHSLDSIYLYDSSGNKIKSVTIQGSGGILGMAVQRSGDIIVSCRDDAVRHVSVDGKITTLINTAPFIPQGVCLTDTEEIVVCMSGQKDKNHVVLYTPDGKSKVREIKARGKDSKQLLTSPYAVVINDDQLVVVNHHCNVMSLDQQSSEVLWVYDGKQAKLDVQFTPLGICNDKFSNLLVTDQKNHCIHYLDRKGILIKVFMTKNFGLQNPWGIGVDNEWIKGDRIWCGSANSQEIFLLKYLK